MFKYIRIQIVHPCRAKCVWCSTHEKNPLFQKLTDSGEAENFHQTYLDIIRRYRPREVYISGGEPLLYPKIESFLNEVAQHTDAIHLFTSYQFSRGTMGAVSKMNLPTEQLILNHTPIYFEPARWHKLTQGFPFDVYLDNVRAAVALPVRKRFKFIINHSAFADEISRFQEMVQPNESCEVSLKLMNDQGDGLVAPTLRRTADRVLERLGNLDAVLAQAGWRNKTRPRGSADLVKGVVETGDVNQCIYRKEPLELRLAYVPSRTNKKILKYRYCPYFPPDFGHRFHVGRDDLAKLGRNYRKGPFREHCDRCRLLHYRPSDEKRRGDGESKRQLPLLEAGTEV